jgi:hypothetical protein
MVLIFLIVLVLIGLIPLVTKKPNKWFPSPGSWLRALALAIPSWFGLVILPSLLGCLCLAGLILAINTEAPLNAIINLAAVGLLFLVASFFWYWLLVGLYSLVLRFLWAELPKFLRWLEPPKKKRDILFGWLALSSAALIGVTPFLILALYSDHPNNFVIESRRHREYQQALEQAFGEGAFISWFVVCAYLYQIRSAYVRVVAKKRKARQLRA